MRFGNDVVLMYGSRKRVNQKLELCRRTLEANGFMLSRYKIKYIKCDFYATTQKEWDLRLGGHVVPKKDTIH
jgi:hypothetical protein